MTVLVPVHAVEKLWAIHHPTTGYPRGIVAVPAPLPGLGFFPGGWGLWRVDPRRPLPPFPVGGIMVLGHDFHSEVGYLASMSLGGERLSMPTWRNLLRLFEQASVPLASCFFTNFYMGLREGSGATGPFPGAGNAAFVEHCSPFLIEQIRVQRPALILTLGRYVPPALAKLSPNLACWSGVSGFKDIDAAGPVQYKVPFPGIDGFACTTVALIHPSLRLVSLSHRRYEGSVGADAELRMLASALRAANLLVC